MDTSPRQLALTLLASIVVSLGAVPFHSPSVQAQQLTERDSTDLTDVAKPVAAEAAGAIGKRIEGRLAENANAKPLRIAIFPFGDEQGKVTLDNHDVSFKAQGAFAFALGQTLANNFKGKFLLLDKFALARELRDGGIDPASISAENPDLPATLARVSIDVAILGSTKYGLDGMTMQPRLVFAGADGGGSVLTTQPSPGAEEMAQTRTFAMSDRLGLQIWRRAGTTFQQIPIVTTNSEESMYGNILFALVPAGSEGTEFLLRISNKGVSPSKEVTPGLGIYNPDPVRESRRLFGVVLTIDGVNSFYQDFGDGEAKPVVVHPRNASKWILGPPGYRIAPAANPSGYQLAPVQGAGHSVVDVQGFQLDGQYARAFTFASASGSLAAEKVGISDEIGVITACFFAEKLPGDQEAFASAMGPPRIGTAAGRQVLQPIFRINPKYHKEPVLTIKVFYRSPNDCPIPRQEQVVVSGGR